MLRQKDESDDNLSETFRQYDWVKKNKNSWFIHLQEDSGYNKKLMSSCIKPCFTNLDTMVVSLEESECMTNCMGKGMEVLGMFKNMNAGEDLKRYGGYKQ